MEEEVARIHGPRAAEDEEAQILMRSGHRQGGIVEGMLDQEMHDHHHQEATAQGMLDQEMHHNRHEVTVGDTRMTAVLPGQIWGEADGRPQWSGRQTQILVVSVLVPTSRRNKH